jgi:hypothetical protein
VEIQAATGVIEGVTAARKRVVRKAAGRRHRRLATRAGLRLPQRLRRSSRAGLCRTSADRCGAKRRRNNPRTTTKASSASLLSKAARNFFQIPGDFYHLKKIRITRANVPLRAVEPYALFTIRDTITIPLFDVSTDFLHERYEPGIPHVHSGD